MRFGVDCEYDFRGKHQNISSMLVRSVQCVKVGAGAEVVVLKDREVLF